MSSRAISRFSRKNDQNGPKMAQIGPSCQQIVSMAKKSEKLFIENPKIPEMVPMQLFQSFLVAEISKCLELILLLSTRTQDFALRGHLVSMLEESASHQVFDKPSSKSNIRPAVFRRVEFRSS